MEGRFSLSSLGKLKLIVELAWPLPALSESDQAKGFPRQAQLNTCERGRRKLDTQSSNYPNTLHLVYSLALLAWCFSFIISPNDNDDDDDDDDDDADADADADADKDDARQIPSNTKREGY